MNNLFSYSFIFMIIVVILVSCISSYTLDYSYYNINQEDIYISEKGFAWPIPSFTRISSYYGARTSPTSFASSFHYGLDIPAPEGTYFISSISGNVVFTGFNGSGGYTIIIENENTRVIYCHVSPNFLVNVGEYVEQAQVIGQVGPYHVYDVIGNPYRDKEGIPTNRCNNWLSSSFCHKNKWFLSRSSCPNSNKKTF